MAGSNISSVAAASRCRGAPKARVLLLGVGVLQVLVGISCDGRSVSAPHSQTPPHPVGAVSAAPIENTIKDGFRDLSWGDPIPKDMECEAPSGTGRVRVCHYREEQPVGLLPEPETVRYGFVDGKLYEVRLRWAWIRDGASGSVMGVADTLSSRWGQPVEYREEKHARFEWVSETTTATLTSEAPPDGVPFVTSEATRRAISSLGKDPDDPDMAWRGERLGMSIGPQPKTSAERRTWEARRAGLRSLDLRIFSRSMADAVKKSPEKEREAAFERTF